MQRKSSVLAVVVVKGEPRSLPLKSKGFGVRATISSKFILV